MTEQAGAADRALPPTATPAHAVDAEHAVALAREQLRQARAALARVTGGASPSVVLAELAQELAADLALQWDELPGHVFTGRVARAAGVLGSVVPRRGVPHRVVLARYLTSTPVKVRGDDHQWRWAGVAVLGLGADGVLRVGRVEATIRLRRETAFVYTPLRWDDERIRRVPSRSVRVARWTGGGRAGDVAAAAEVLDALAALASTVAASSQRDLALLQRLLGPAG